MKKLFFPAILFCFVMMACENKNSSTVGHYEEPLTKEEAKKTEVTTHEEHATKAADTNHADTTKKAMTSDTLHVHGQGN